MGLWSKILVECCAGSTSCRVGGSAAREQEEFLERLGLRDSEISDLRDTLNEQTEEYADLLEIKIKLDNEITAYRKLLEGEEERFDQFSASVYLKSGHFCRGKFCFDIILRVKFRSNCSSYAPL